MPGDGRERPNGAVGVGAAVDGISQAHRAFFAAGSLTPADRRWAADLLSAESVLEAFSAISLTKELTVTFNYQHVENWASTRIVALPTSSPHACTLVFQRGRVSLHPPSAPPPRHQPGTWRY
ncbi:MULTISPECIES: carbohydrate porin [Methylorubrum]|uniref:carbohydrate porin n=1 Tax=Methylorubrum TaxID=2282523 RepID=UPI0016136C38